MTWAEAGQVPQDITWPQSTRVQVFRDLTSRHQYVLVFSVSTFYFRTTLDD